MNKDGLFRTAGIIAILTILSKIIGFLRDIVIAGSYGASAISDAYFYAYQIPALALILFGGLGGPFHTATIAYFSKKISAITDKPQEDVKNLLYKFLSATFIVFGFLSILVFCYSTDIIEFLIKSANIETIEIASEQLKIMSPVLLFGGLIGIFYGVHNIYKSFAIPSLSPMILSVSMIISLLFFKDNNGMILAYSTLVGAGLMLLAQLPKYFNIGFRLVPDFKLKNYELKNIGEILFPAMLGTTIGQINIYIDMFFASQLPAGAWSAIGYSNRLFQFPTGVLITAMLVPLFPILSKFAGDKKYDNLKEYFFKGLMSLWILAFPVFAFILIFAKDAVYVLFERGAFDANDTMMVVTALSFLSVSIISYVARDSFTRVFYAFNDTKTPFMIGLFAIGVKFLMNSLLVAPLGIAGITLSTAIVSFSNMTLLGLLIRKKIDLNYKRFFLPVLKVIFITLIIGVLGYLLNSIDFGITTKAFILGKLIILPTILLTFYLVLCSSIKVPYTKEILLKLNIIK